ncbi:MAG: 5-bromo-4-chloroindolyl phosphate hydrolysis family protein [Oscillospiraceae bacterium]
MDNDNGKRSGAAYYAAAAAVILYALIFPLYKPLHYVLAALVCGAVFMIVDSISARHTGTRNVDRAKELEKEADRQKSTGNKEADELLTEGRQRLANIVRSQHNIKNEQVRAKAAGLIDVCEKIFDYVSQHPDAASKLREFKNFFLPSLEKLLSSYEVLESTNSTGENVTTTMDKINGILDTMQTAFEKQLDALFEDTAVDITSDISVLKAKLSEGGLSEFQIGASVSSSSADSQSAGGEQQTSTGSSL